MIDDPKLAKLCARLRDDPGFREFFDCLREHADKATRHLINGANINVDVQRGYVRAFQQLLETYDRCHEIAGQGKVAQLPKPKNQQGYY